MPERERPEHPVEHWTQDIHQGDAVETLREMPESSVHMAMTSPPYWQLRDYGEDGQLGLESTAEQYVDNIARVMDEVKRVLRPDGNLWLNLGDTYADKDLQQIPSRVALELQSRGWVLRNRATWVKPNPMPQSVKDRLNDTTEAVFHFSPSKRYWYDLDAVREPYSESMERRKHCQSKHGGHEDSGWGDGNHHEGGLLDDSQTYEDTMHPGGKNPGDVFEVTTKPFPEAHFAVYPPELCESPIKASCPPKVCIQCGSPHERQTEIERGRGSSPSKRDGESNIDAQVNGGHQRDGHDYKRKYIKSISTIGWRQTCDCDTDSTETGIVLDPFAGAGTTALVAKRLGRRFVGIDLNPEYVAMAQKRVGVTVDEPERLLEDGETALTAYGAGGESDD